MRSSQSLTLRQRRLLYRAWHRGIREMDLILGRFADAEIASFDDASLDSFEQVLELPDKQLFAWITGASAVPADQNTAMYLRLLAFHQEQGD